MRGQASLEAMVIGAVFLAILGMFAQVLEGVAGDSGVAKGFAEAEAEAGQCALLLDSLYANKGGVLYGPEAGAGCVFEGAGVIGVKFNGTVVKASVVNPGVGSGVTGLVVESQKHYRE